MKYSGNATIATLTTREAPIAQSISCSIRKHSILLTCCLFTMLASLNIAAVLGMSSILIALLFDGLLCSLMFVIASLARSTPVLPAGLHRPYEIDGAGLLEREVIALDISQEAIFLQGKRILVTGAAGSIGSELCRQVLACEPALLIALDTNETGLFDLLEELHTVANQPNVLVTLFIGDITNKARMARLFSEQRPEIIFHAAAYKHVPLLEQYPDLAIHTNALATNQLCQLAQEYGANCFVLISTDKAVEPVCVMGASKRLAEMIIQAMARSASGPTRFCAVRFGNVLGSRGSVVPTFARQIEKGGPLTVTDARATRYFMTIPEACKLVILTPAIAEQGDLYLLNMGKPMRILDLAVKMIHLSGRDISIVYTGLRPGERLHETLVANNEELVPTINSNILCIAQKNTSPSLATILQFIATLEEDLQLGDTALLRERLFEVIGKPKDETGSRDSEGRKADRHGVGGAKPDPRGYEYVAG